MEQSQAKNLITNLFTKSFNLDNYQMFLVELLGTLDEDSGFNYRTGNVIAEKYWNRIASYKRIAKYIDSNDKKVDLLVVNLKEECNLERHRSSLRNFIMEHLNKTATRDAAVVAFVAHDKKRWRLSLVCLETELKITDKGNLKTTEKATPAKRYSFLLGETEPSHTAQQQFLPLLIDNKYNPSLEQLEKIFAVERLSDAFFNEYVQLLDKTKHAILAAAREDNYYQLSEETINSKKNSYIKYHLRTLDNKTIDVGNFAKKLLGQIVFLYFLQKKGWLGVAKDKSWGTGNKIFMRDIFSKYAPQANNYFNQFLEPLFYEALASGRIDDYFTLFDCKIPFLNGGLFEAYHGYDRVNHGLKLPNNLFSNDEKIKATKNSIEMSGTGILDVFDRYNFTVCEDEPLEKEVAIDPEMLGKIFENTIEDNERKGKGAFYTPRPIVHYMVKQSLIEYLTSHLDYINDIKKPDLFNDATTIAVDSVIPAQAVIHEETNPLVTRDDLQLLINQAEFYLEHETKTYDKTSKGEKETKNYSHQIPKVIVPAAQRIDKLLADVLILDPAVGSGAFPVGLLTELVKVRQLLQIYCDSNKTAYQLKYHAIANSIYGVDIDSGAIDVARLRLWLSLVVDEEDNNQQIQPLPNLDYKLVCGNSLTRVNLVNNGNVDIFLEQKLDRLLQLEEQFIDESRIKQKQNLKTEIDQLLANIMHDGFDFRYVFGKYRDGDGFDIVIGNPPYIDSEEMSNHMSEFRDYLSSNYKFTVGNWDIYIVFFELGFNLLKNNGTLTFITPDKWLAKPFGHVFRRNIFENFKILVKCGRNVFSSAKVDAIISLINKTASNELLLGNYCDGAFIAEKIVNKVDINSEQIDMAYSSHFALILKLNQCIKLGKFYQCENACATSDAYKLKDFIFDSDSNQSQDVFCMVNTGTLGRYSSKYGKTKMSYLGGKYLFPKVNISDFTDNFGTLYLERSKSPKIIIKGLTLLDAFIDFKGAFIPGKSTLLIREQNEVKLKYLSAIINSKLSFFIIKEKNSSSSYNGGVNFNKAMIEDLPFVEYNLLSNEHKDLLINLVDEILILTSQADYLTNEESQKQVLLYQKQIDQLVYQLYELSPDEISLIEGK